MSRVRSASAGANNRVAREQAWHAVGNRLAFFKCGNRDNACVPRLHTPPMPAVVFAEFMHETNSFSVRRTGEAEFRRGHLLRGDAALRAFAGTHSAPGAAIDAAQALGWSLRLPLAAEATPSGLVRQPFFEQVCTWLTEALQPTPDGVLLHLHGSMATEASHDGDGDLLQRLRKVLGPHVPMVVVLDLHATVTQAMAEAVQGLVAYRTYPHVDMYERTRQAALLLDSAMAGRTWPVVSLARAPLLYGCDGGRTTDPASPMNALLAQAQALEQAGKALVVSVQAGFSSIDSPDIGPSVAVTTDGQPIVGQQLAQQLAEQIWGTRHHNSVVLMPVAQAMALAAAPPTSAHPGPLVVADHADNPGAGGYGDATVVLRAMLAAGLTNAIFYALHDPAAVFAATQAGVGTELTLDIGGHTAPHMGGGPLRVRGVVHHLSDGRYTAAGSMGGGVSRNDGPTALLRVGGVTVVLSSSNPQATDLAQLTSLGLQPETACTIAVKSMQHFRAAFQPIARQIVDVDSGALCTRNVLARPYRRVRRPIHPLDVVTYP